MRQPRRNSCRPFGTSDAPSSPTTGSRPWLHLVVPPGLNHIPKNHVDCVLPMFSLIKILHGVALWGFEYSLRIFPGRCPGLSHCVPLARKHGECRSDCFSLLWIVITILPEQNRDNSDALTNPTFAQPSVTLPDKLGDEIVFEILLVLRREDAMCGHRKQSGIPPGDR